MLIKSFIADDVRQALAMVREEMGEDAVVLDTRSVKAARFFGIGTKQQVEVMAGIDDPIGFPAFFASSSAFRITTAVTYAPITNPQRYPPPGPISISIPDAPPANTGSPKAPTRR